MADGKPASFPDAFGISRYAPPPPRTLNELLMIKLSASIRSKSEWWKKYKTPEIRAHWREEALNTEMVWVERATMLVPLTSAAEYTIDDIDDSIVRLNEEEVDYVLDELDGYSKLLDEETGIEVSCFDGTWHSDRLVDNRLRERLRKGIEVLEDVPKAEKDWHPGSDGQVLDLVHPSLYCAVYGRTLAISRSRSGDGSSELRKVEAHPLTVPAFIEKHKPDLYSERFQWLPTDFTVGDDGKVKALGYINNLLPYYTGFYETIEDIIANFVPLFEHVLTDMLNPLPQRLPGDYRPLKDIDPRFPANRSDRRYWTQASDYFRTVWPENKIVGLPTLPEGGYTGGLEERENVVSLRGRTIQVIVKLANIHLTPDKPEYKGGSWHIEGMANERIVASGLYYYDQENISESELAFRIAIDGPDIATRIQANPYDYHAHYKTWGMIMNYDDSTELNNVVGATPTIQGRCLAFPNTYQHRVSSFRLSDPSRPGHRKILALFLVDPSIDEPIPSTTIVPPQQCDWVRQALHDADSSSLLKKLPIELIDAVADMSGPGVMTEEEAKRIRVELMDERRVREENLPWDESLFSRVFDLCEH